MDIYRRIALIRTEEQADDLTDELIDRFGDPPPGVNTLIQVALLRGEAGRAGITDISQKNGRLIFVMKDLDVQTLLDLCSREEYKGILKAEPGDKPTVSLKIISRSRITDQARKFVRSLEKE
jgi:transcription-repair coupling factor (superfamily II helicase)